MNIGRVEKDSYVKDGVKVPTYIMDIRTVTFRKKFTLSVNKDKYKDGIIKPENIKAGSENKPDYHIWANLANRGETMRSEIVGSLKNYKSEKGVFYKKGYLFDPFIQNTRIYITLFAVDENRKKNEEHIYNVVCEPYMDNRGQGQQQAQPSYNANETGNDENNNTNSDEEEIEF
jgi:hypothetical protein